MDLNKFSKKVCKIPSRMIPFAKHKISHSIAYLNDESVRNMSARLEALNGKYTGQRCFIMGNGPSLNKMNLELLKNESVWGSNKIYLLFDRISWRPTFYTAVDTRVVPDVAADINQLVNDLPTTQFFFPGRFRDSNTIKSSDNVYWFPEINKTDIFSLNVSKWVASVRTVTISAMQLAAYMGFNPIYLIGCDTSYTIPNTVDYEGSSDLLVSKYNDDPNHFDGRYFGEESKWHDPHVERMISHYEVSKVVCDSENIKIYNATIGGNLEVFPRVDYNKLFE